MKSWKITDIRWANTGDLCLPFWKEWNKKNALPGNFWQRIWEYPYICSKIPSLTKNLDVGGTYPFVLFKNFPNTVSLDSRNLNKLNHPLHYEKWPKNKLIIADALNLPFKDNHFDYSFSISSIEEMPDIFKVLKEMLRVTKHRTTVTFDVSDKLGVPHTTLREIEKYINCRLPGIPHDALHSTSDILKRFNQSKNKDFKHIRILGITFDSCDPPKSVGILVPHRESFPFLKLCLESILKYKNKNLKEKIYVLDDNSQDGSFEKAKKLFKEEKEISFFRFKRADRIFPNIGSLLDLGINLIEEQYVTMIDADVFPINSYWISFPIWLIEKYNCSSVGTDTGLSTPYLSKTKTNIWHQPEDGYLPTGGLYDNEWFTCTNNFYRVMPTALAKIVSKHIGFSRGNLAKNKILIELKHKLPKISFLDMIINKRFPYLPEGCDNGVAANHFIDINRLGPKFNIPLTSFIDLTTGDGAFGQNISGLIFHLSLSTRVLASNPEIKDAGKDYHYWVDKIKNIKNVSDKNFTEIIKRSSHFRPGGYDSSIPSSWYKKEYDYVQNLIKEYEQKKT